MHRSALLVVILAMGAAGCASEPGADGSGGTTTTPAPSTGPPATIESSTTLPFSAAPVDWNDRASVDIDLPTGWHLAACDGDAPFLCASTADGTIDGTILLLEYPAPAHAGTRDDVEGDADELYRVTEEDRRSTCGPDYRVEADTLTELTVGGKPGHRFGYELRDPDGDVTERVILHVVRDGARQILISTAFSDPEGCPGEDPERNEFPIAALPAIEPYLDRIAAQSVLPAPAGPG